MKIYLVYLDTCNVMVSSNDTYLVKALSNKDDANNFLSDLEKELEEKYEHIIEREEHCNDCCYRYECDSCEWYEGKEGSKYSDYLFVKIANGETIEVDCDDCHGDNPRYYIEEVELC